MGKKLYVGNLPFSTRDQALSDAFSQCGNVESVRIITDRETGRSKGFAFVEMSSDEEATAAIDKLNGYEMDGRTITVSEARPMPPREPRTGGGGGSRGGFGGDRGGDRGGRGGFGGGGNRNRY